MNENTIFRTLIRAIRYDDAFVYAIIPGWDIDHVISIPKNIIPEFALVVIETEIDIEGFYRFHARVNLNAQDESELNFSEPWEIE